MKNRSGVSGKEMPGLSGNPPDKYNNRTYKNKSVVANDQSDLISVLNAHRIMRNKPVIVSLKISKSTYYIMNLRKKHMPEGNHLHGRHLSSY